MQNKFERNKLLINAVIKAFEKRNFNAFYCENKEDVIKKITELTKPTETFSWGGSVTLDETGLKDYLIKNNYNVIDRAKASTPEEKRKIILEGLCADNFLMSANAISYDGELVNIDGHGNRIAALCYGPKKVFVIAGVNKIEKTLDDAIKRARTKAAPINAKRVSSVFKVDTPCIKTGICADCKSETSICSDILITRLSFPKGRINVLLVNGDFGY